MVQSVLLRGATEASSSASVLRTPRLEAELAARRSLYIKVGDMTGFAGLLKILLLEPLKDLLKLRPKLPPLEAGQANTAFWHAAGRLFAVFEASLPFELDLRSVSGGAGVEVISVGYEHFGHGAGEHRLQHPMTAHPKVDPAGETTFFGYSLTAAAGEAPLHHSVLSRDGELLRTTPIELNTKIMLHDFAITERFSIIPDLPLQFAPREMVATGSPFMLNTSATPRFGLLERHTAGAQVRWFEFASPARPARPERETRTHGLRACEPTRHAQAIQPARAGAGARWLRRIPHDGCVGGRGRKQRRPLRVPAGRLQPGGVRRPGDAARLVPEAVAL